MVILALDRDQWMRDSWKGALLLIFKDHVPMNQEPISAVESGTYKIPKIYNWF